MPVKHHNIARCLLLCGLLPAINAQAEELPSMAFLEYLGGVENEVDGQLSSPLELDLEAVSVAGSGKQIDDEVQADSEAGSEAGKEAGKEEGIDE